MSGNEDTRVSRDLFTDLAAGESTFRTFLPR